MKAEKQFPKVGKAAINEPLDLTTVISLWNTENWDAIVSLAKTIKFDESMNKVAIIVAASFIQLNLFLEAKKQIVKLKLTNDDRLYLKKVLIAGSHSKLSKLYAISSQYAQSYSHQKKALITITHESALTTLNQHLIEQQVQIKFEKMLINVANQYTQTNRYLAQIISDLYIQNELAKYPQSYPLLIASAESAMLKQDYQEAIKRWQHMASISGDDMPKPYYDRLLNSYVSISSFPLASPEEEFIQGDFDKHDFLAKLHQALQPKVYLEIGVQSGKSLALATCRAIGIDPMPRLSITLGPLATLIEETSDEFFKKLAPEMLVDTPDLVFIDGMHLFEFALRDFINVEKYSNNKTTVVIDDIFPNHPAQAERDRVTRAWAGDVWKLLAILEKYRPDLNIKKLNANPTGLMLVTNLDNKNTILKDHYSNIIIDYAKISQVPDKYINREGCDKDYQLLNQENSH